MALNTIKGKTAYDILEMPECPYRLPRAFSYSQAGGDYKNLEPIIFEWYENFISTK